MEDESKVQGMVKWGLGALGLGAVAAVVTVPQYGLLVALVILVLALLLFGGYYLWWRARSRRQRERFSAVIEAETRKAPTVISDPNSRAKLDDLRQKFQKGLGEFKSRGKDLYKLPWYVIIGEPGSGKTEALRHSGIEFPPGLQDELQGSGGTVNMDWWFTNRAVILDTAGSMVFNEARAAEAPEWREFLRLLKKARPHSPINGLFLVLSVESLIKDSSDTIAQKASRLAQQLDLIQRTLDVRFPVYLLVTKCDLLTGFREFFDNIDDPLLQHQMFGWSNPSPLDDHFRPDLVEQYLTSIVERLRRRRLALLREGSGGGRLGDTAQFFASTYQLGRGPAPARRLDEVDAMFALPESITRLAPRLRRYLETVFVAGEWSAKPVFLRGIYFTTSMREGKALDEAIALATGLSLDQLPEERMWEKNRAFFLRDLFHEKVFRESGLVTRATNTLQLLRTRQLAIFGTAGGALLLLLAFGWYGKHQLKASAGDEKKYWQVGAKNLQNGKWRTGSVVSPVNNEQFRFSYAGESAIDEKLGKLTVVKYHEELRRKVRNKLSGGWIFRPISLGRSVDTDRRDAQRVLFETGVLKPLIDGTRYKLQGQDSPPGDRASVARQKDALLSLMQLEADRLRATSSDSFIAGTNAAEKHLKKFLSYLTEDPKPKLDPILAAIFCETYSEKSKWPPESLFGGGNSLSSSPALYAGLTNFHKATSAARTNINQELKLLDELTDRLKGYHSKELSWLASVDRCTQLDQAMRPLKDRVDESWLMLQTATNLPFGSFTNLTSRYFELAKSASDDASASALSSPLTTIMMTLPPAQQDQGLFPEIKRRLQDFAEKAGDVVLSHLKERNDKNWVAVLDNSCIGSKQPAAYQLRWRLYTNACGLEQMIGLAPWNMEAITNARKRFVEIEGSWKADNLSGIGGVDLSGFRKSVGESKQKILMAIDNDVRKRLRFPVLLSGNAANAMNVRDLSGLRSLLNGLQTELQDTNWQSGSSESLTMLKANCERFASLVSSLVSEDGKAAGIELYFQPPQAGQGNDETIIKIFRDAWVTIGSSTNNWLGLREAVPGQVSWKGTIDQGISIRFARNQNGLESVVPITEPDWGLVRLIQRKLASSQDGKEWTIPIKLVDSQKDAQGNYFSGYAVFKARLVGQTNSLPQFDTWPKQ